MQVYIISRTGFKRNFYNKPVIGQLEFSRNLLLDIK